MPVITELQKLPGGKTGVVLDLKGAPEGGWVQIYFVEEIETLKYQVRVAERERIAKIADDYVAAVFKECNASRDALATFDATMAEIGGCSNHGCMIAEPVGMGTNGPCKCLEDKHTSRRFGVAVRRLRNALDAANSL